jgi:hypothetical protein
MEVKTGRFSKLVGLSMKKFMLLGCLLFSVSGCGPDKSTRQLPQTSEVIPDLGAGSKDIQGAGGGGGPSTSTSLK